MRLLAPAVLAAALSSAGCLAAPWATPPIRASIGSGARVAERAHGRGAPSGNVALRASLEPLQLVPPLADRPFDVGLGWLYEPGAAAGASVYGPYLESGWVIFSGAPRRTASSSTWGRALRPFQGQHPCGLGAPCTRFSFRTRVASIRAGDGDGTGVQLAAQLALEHGGFARWMGGGGSGDRGNGVAAGGMAWGEGGVGVYAELVRSEVAGARWWQLSGGLAVRVPASFGGFFAFCGECAAAAAFH